MGFETVARTHVGCRRKVNEDALLARPDLGLWAVADGMGGHHAGDVASALVIAQLAASSPGLPLAERTLQARRLLEAANNRLIELARSEAAQRTIGSTVTALLLGDGGYACLWAGDSRGYRARDRALSQLTHDHSLVQELVDLGEITQAEAQDHPNANIITRAVGANPGLEIDVVQDEVRPGDVFLLASDGLTRLASEDELLEALEDRDLEAAADRLVDLCLQRGAPDNLSFIMLRVRPD